MGEKLPKREFTKHFPIAFLPIFTKKSIKYPAYQEISKKVISVNFLEEAISFSISIGLISGVLMSKMKHFTKARGVKATYLVCVMS